MRNHGAKLQDGLVDLIKDNPILVGPGSSHETIAECAKDLIKEYRFFDSPYVMFPFLSLIPL